MYYFVINNFDVVNAVVGADIPKSTPGFATELAAMLLVTLFKYMAIALVTNITLYYLLLPVGLIMSFCGYAALYILKKLTLILNKTKYVKDLTSNENNNPKTPK